MSAARRPQRQGRTLREAFADDGVEPVVNSILVFPQKFHNRVVRPAEETVKMYKYIYLCVCASCVTLTGAISEDNTKGNKQF